jgi:hypothetical protein
VALYGGQLAADPAADRAWYERAVDLLGSAGDLSNRLVATRLLAESLAEDEPRDIVRSGKLLADAADLAYSHGDLDSVARSRMTEANLAWRLGDEDGWTADRRARAVALADQAFEAIEALRDLQADDGVRAEVFSRWAFFYDRILDHLLGAAGGTPSRTDLAKAFEVAERMRARVLLEKLDMAGVPLADPSRVERLAARHRLVEKAARLRVELSSPLLADADRASRVASLRKLSEDEESLRHALASEDPRFASLRAQEIPSLDQVESALGADEAVLAFTTGTGLLRPPVRRAASRCDLRPAGGRSHPRRGSRRTAPPSALRGAPAREGRAPDRRRLHG